MLNYDHEYFVNRKNRERKKRKIERERETAVQQTQKTETGKRIANRDKIFIIIIYFP